ncbi:MAG: HAMP domain-containing histidine kinase [Clostridia bacterium]|nr:HAMP domain-containing histidine kinase [Clostridia bacterium]
MAQSEKKSKQTLLGRIGLNSGIRRRWFINNMSVVILMLLLAAALVAVFCTYYFYASVQNRLENQVDTTSKYFNRYFSASYSDFYEYGRNMTQNFSLADRLELQILDESGKVMFSSSGLTAGFTPETDEIARAFANGQVETYTGYDRLTEEKVMAATAPVYYRSGRLIGGVRCVSSLQLLDQQLRTIYLWAVAAVILLIALIIFSNSFFLKSIVGPVLHINDFAKKITGGQYGIRLNADYNDEIGELCSTLNEMSAELSRVEKTQNDFISSVSHELRTPLTAISGWADTIEGCLDDPQLATQGLTIIKKETRRLSQMVEELLDFSRIEGGGMRLQTEPFDLRGDLYDAVFTYTDMLQQEGMRIEYEEPDEPIMVFADRNRLKQVFLNIIDNAGKYGKDGDRVQVAARVEGGSAVVTIRDFGQGIRAEELPFVKQKFYKGSAKGRGAGIGLSVCNDIVGMHGGTLDIDSVYGEGTSVRITLPLYQDHSAE